MKFKISREHGIFMAQLFAMWTLDKQFPVRLPVVPIWETNFLIGSGLSDRYCAQTEYRCTAMHRTGISQVWDLLFCLTHDMMMTSKEP